LSDHYSDDELLAGLRQKDKNAYYFDLLVRKYQQKLYWMIRRMVTDHDDANDVLQNVWIKVFRNIDNFKEESQLYTWLFRIASNETLTFIDKEKKKQKVRLEDAETAVNQKVDSGMTEDFGDNLQAKLLKAIDALPEKQKLVFQLRYYDEMPYEEISKVLNTSVGALKASYHHAAKKIEENIINKD